MANNNTEEGQDGNVHGDMEGPNAMYIKLISSDEHEFIIKKEYALVSSTIKAMLTGPGEFLENETNEIRFRNIPSEILKIICIYFQYKAHYQNSRVEIPDFPISSACVMELLMAANFLGC